jgi:hypothetical protein
VARRAWPCARRHRLRHGPGGADASLTTNRHGRANVLDSVRPVSFSLSQTRDFVGCAVSDLRPVGFDTEDVSRDIHPDLLRECFTHCEAAYVRQAAPVDGNHAFFTSWTLKEAYLKARGIGLALPLTSFEILRNGNGWALRHLAPDGDSEGWHFVSSTIGLQRLGRGEPVRKTAVVGTGLIARTIAAHLVSAGYYPPIWQAYDHVPAVAGCFQQHVQSLDPSADVVLTADVEEACRKADVVVFATTASKPYLDDPELFGPGQTVLHISLRDLGPLIIQAAANYADCEAVAFSHATSLELAEAAAGH